MRPVVPGNRGVNTHLSEMISEILEPLVLETNGGEIASTEEALCAITRVNNLIEKSAGDWKELNLMGGTSPDVKNISRDINSPTEEIHDHLNRTVGMDGMNKTTSGGVGVTLTPEKHRSAGMDGMNKHPSGGVGVPLTPLIPESRMATCNTNDISTVVVGSPREVEAEVETDTLNESDEEVMDMLVSLFTIDSTLFTFLNEQKVS